MYIIYIHTYVYTIVEHKCWQHLSISAFLKISVIFCPAFPEALQVAKREMGTRPSNTLCGNYLSNSVGWTIVQICAGCICLSDSSSFILAYSVLFQVYGLVTELLSMEHGNMIEILL